ncbi:MAG: hypothetical protein J7M19_08945 [Planctomycetes bacterium]|nr:hypothetical protein [Planctomycetota bacterium]
MADVKRENVLSLAADEIARRVADRQHLVRVESEDYLRRLTFEYPQRREALWKRDYSSVDAYIKSVEPNRRRWREILGEFDSRGADFAPLWQPFFEDDKTIARRLTIQVAPGLSACAIVGLPKKAAAGAAPLVVCQHGIGSSPERVFGFDDPENVYKGYGRALAEEGFAVVAPLNTSHAEPRARLVRMCTMLGKTLWGLEVFKIRRLLDFLETVPEVDVSRTGMYGISLGGAYTSFTVPLEPRIKAAVICAWFNDRINKMIIDDPRYTSFLSSKEEHIFIRGWLAEFADSDLASLICPRPLLVECGKCDGIAWWPQVVAEFERTREHWKKLSLEERCELDLHDGGHEIRGVESFRFLKEWLVDRADELA